MYVTLSIIYIYIYMYVHVHRYIYIYVCLYLYIHIYIYTYLCIYICLWQEREMYVFVCINMFIKCLRQCRYLVSTFIVLFCTFIILCVTVLLHCFYIFGAFLLFWAGMATTLAAIRGTSATSAEWASCYQEESWSARGANIDPNGGLRGHRDKNTRA